MDVKLHKKTWEESVKKHPNIFNKNFNKHMEKVVKRDEGLKKAAYEARKIKQ